ncbi:Oxidoreductase BOA17 like protein [Verticillium longisporum]|uniref:Oxidoreductase BOA17 like protein n=1 Tax=Verticillium longisporum TaxID=100787 RepID=A0A8I2Z493_VERLO|nr:Oxidoreductase BOA17 like protein [Verticillium longisporum]
MRADASPDRPRAKDYSTTPVADGSCVTRLNLPASCDPPPPDRPGRQLVWAVFGGTGHMGRSLVKCALSRGDLVASVGRLFETNVEAMSEAADGDNFLGTLCDVRSADSVERAVKMVLDRFGRVDVIANCSGYGVIGACEDQDEHDLRNQFETNLMGTLNIIQLNVWGVGCARTRSVLRNEVRC